MSKLSTHLTKMGRFHFRIPPTIVVNNDVHQYDWTLTTATLVF